MLQIMKEQIQLYTHVLESYLGHIYDSMSIFHAMIDQ